MSITHNRSGLYMAAMMAAMRGLSPIGNSSQRSTDGAFGNATGARFDNPAGTKLAKRFAKGRGAAPRGY